MLRNGHCNGHRNGHRNGDQYGTGWDAVVATGISMGEDAAAAWLTRAPVLRELHYLGVCHAHGTGHGQRKVSRSASMGRMAIA